MLFDKSNCLADLWPRDAGQLPIIRMGFPANDRRFIAQGTAVLGIGKIAGRQRIEDAGRAHDFLIAVLRGRPEIFESLAVRLPRRLFLQIWDAHIIRYHLPRHDEPMELVFVDDRNGEIHQSRMTAVWAASTVLERFQTAA